MNEENKQTQIENDTNDNSNTDNIELLEPELLNFVYIVAFNQQQFFFKSKRDAMKFIDKTDIKLVKEIAFAVDSVTQEVYKTVNFQD